MPSKAKPYSPESTVLLNQLLLHGGFCTVNLAAAALGVEPAAARRIIGELLAFGYVRRVFLLRAFDASSFYQITRRASRLLGHAVPNCARSDPSDGQILRGLTRFWFATQQPLGLLSEHAAQSVLLQHNIDVPNRWPVGDEYIEPIDSSDALHIYCFPGPDQNLMAFTKQAFLRYVSGLAKVKIGFVIDAKRADEMAALLDEMLGGQAQTAPGPVPDPAPELARIEAEIANLSVKFQAGSATEKAAIRMRIERLLADKKAAERQQPGKKTGQSDGLASRILPMIVHDLY